GSYHNEFFQKPVEAMGLIVASDENHGCRKTRLGEELIEHVRELIRQGVLDIHVLKYQRASSVSKASLVKLTAACGVFAYVTWSKAEEVVLRCGRCGEILKVRRR